MHCCPRPKAEGNSASGHPQHRGGDSFDCCTERYEIVVYCFVCNIAAHVVMYYITWAIEINLETWKLGNLNKGKPSEQLFPIRRLLIYLNRTLYNLSMHKREITPTLTPTTSNRKYYNRSTSLERSVLNCWGRELKHVLRTRPRRDSKSYDLINSSVRTIILYVINK